MEKPSKVMFNIRLNEGQAGKLIRAGVRLVERDRHQDAQLRAAQEEEARANGRDPFRGNRTDATGIKRPDSGTPVFGWKAEGRQMVTLGLALQDVQAEDGGLGMLLTDIHLVRKDGDRMYSLRLTFMPESSVEETAEVSDGAEAVLEYAATRTFEHLHCFRNPDGSLTINSAHALSPEEVRPRFDMRIRADGSIRCERA